jgi:hypothetical protein
LDPREHITDMDRNEDGVVWLKYPPAIIVLKPFNHEFEPFPGFKPGLIPLFLTGVSFNIKYWQNPKTKMHWRQYPICARYTFNNQKAQGQTLEHVVIDIGTTKKFVTPFSVDVALSQSRGWDSVWLLRDFDDTIFRRYP